MEKVGNEIGWHSGFACGYRGRESGKSWEKWQENVAENWYLVGVRPKDTTKPKEQRTDLLFAASKHCFPEQQNWGIFKLRVCAYSWRALSRQQGPSFSWLKSSESVGSDWSLGSHLGSHWSGDWAFQANLYQWNRTGIFTTNIVSLLWLLLLPDNTRLFLHSFVPLRLFTTKICSRSSIVAKLRSQSGLGQWWLLLYQKSHAWFSLSGDPLSYLVTKGVQMERGEQIKWWKEGTMDKNKGNKKL